MNNNSKIGKTIKEYRQKYKLTQNEFAELIGKTGSSVQKYESGVTEIPLSVLEKIAHVFNCHVLDLLDSDSANNWLDSRDNAAINFLNSIGCKVIFDAGHFIEGDAEHSIIYYDSESYLISTDLLLKLFSDMDFLTKNLVLRIIKDNAKFPISDTVIDE